jgi:alpha-tubulin suppressor-like RCC1 family protein
VYSDISWIPKFTNKIANDAQLFSWGQNLSGQLGIGSEKDVGRPTSIDNMIGIVPKKISASKFSTALIDQDGNLYTWGSARNVIQF